MEKRLRYPLDTASFQEIIEEGKLYVDKTAYIDSLVKGGKFYFLARPRRFGKSMLLDTLACYFSNKRGLFKGLAIDRLQPEVWEEYPVLRFNLSSSSFLVKGNLSDKFLSQISRYARQYDIKTDGIGIEDMFYDLIVGLHEKIRKRVVVLIDEYDAPLTATIDRPELQDIYRERLHGLYSVLKEADNHIRFCMLTGVTRYGKVSVFSGLNNLNDITFDDRYAGICGITEGELSEFYAEGIGKFASENEISEEEAYSALKSHYDGYHFSRKMLDVYNPFSINHALDKGIIKDYWCSSGAPTIFLKHLKEVDYNLDEMIGKSVNEASLSNLSVFTTNPIPLFYQTGYLTLKSFDKETKLYTIGFPNREVEEGLLRNILEVYVPENEVDTDSYIYDMQESLKKGNPEKFIGLLKTFFAGIPTKLHTYVGRYENYYHTIIYSLLKLIGLKVYAEYATSGGFIDILVSTKDYIYVIELKVNGTAEEGIKQIEKKGYSDSFAYDGQEIYEIGIGFSKQTQNIDSYLIRKA